MPTAQRVIEMAATRPELRQFEVAAMVGVSRQRVGEIVKKHGLIFASRPKRLCLECARPVRSGGERHAKCRKASFRSVYTCVVCGAHFAVRTTAAKARTPSCGYSEEYEPRYCSRVCWLNRYPQTISCWLCGKEFESSPAMRYAARRGVQSSCPDCRPEARRLQAAAMRAKRRPKVAVS